MWDIQYFQERCKEVKIEQRSQIENKPESDSGHTHTYESQISAQSSRSSGWAMT